MQAAQISSDHHRNPALDGVRGLAILIVLFHHCFMFTRANFGSSFERVLYKFGSEGWMGVDLFFALSGFLITGILLNTKERGGYFKNFYIRRVLRIFPLYYLFVAVFFLVLPVFSHNPELRGEVPHQLWYWTYLSNVYFYLHNDFTSMFTAHTWSLAVEEQFYLVWPLVVFLLSDTALLWSAGAICLASLALRCYLLFSGHSIESVRVLTPSHLDGLMIGAMIAVSLRKNFSRKVWKAFVTSGVAIGLFLRIAVPVISRVTGAALVPYALAISGWSILFGALLALVVSPAASGTLQKFFSARPLTFLGTYSYGLYLVHQPIYNALSEIFAAHAGSTWQVWLMFAFIATPLSILVAFISYNLYEKPFLALKNRFSTRRSGK